MPEYKILSEAKCIIYKLSWKFSSQPKTCSLDPLPIIRQTGFARVPAHSTPWKNHILLLTSESLQRCFHRWSVSIAWIYLWVATSVILTIDVKSSAVIYKGSALNLWWLYSGIFTPDEYYNIVEFRPTGAGTRRDEVVEEIQQLVETWECTTVNLKFLLTASCLGIMP